MALLADGRPTHLNYATNRRPPASSGTTILITGPHSTYRSNFHKIVSPDLTGVAPKLRSAIWSLT